MSAVDPSTLNYGGLPFRVCLFFACAPDEELTAGDISSKFDVPTGKTVVAQLNRPLRDGYLSVSKREQARGSPFNVYSAGPVLLRMLGRVAT